MSTILHPIAAAIYLVHLGINIALLFLLVRLILTWRSVAWLVPLGTVGRPITDAMTAAVAGRLQGRFHGRKLSERGKLFVCVALLTLADLCLVALSRGMS
jgi:hypothetical protein